MWRPSQTVYLEKLQIAISFWPFSWLVRFPGLEGDGPAPSILRAVVTRAWGVGAGWHCSPQCAASSCQMLPVPSGCCCPSGHLFPSREDSWDRAELRSAFSSFQNLTIPVSFLVLLILKGRVFLKPIFYCFTGVLAEIRRRCLCSDYHPYPEVRTTDI